MTVDVIAACIGVGMTLVMGVVLLRRVAGWVFRGLTD